MNKRIEKISAEEIVDLGIKLSKPFYRGEDIKNSDSKEFAIMEELKNYNPYYHPGVGIILPAIEDTKIVVVCHMDVVSCFQKGFLRGESFQIREEDDVVSGPLDNTLPNAVLITAIKELKSKNLAQNIEFLFTEGEETGLTGMRNYMRERSGNWKSDVFYINMDVTWDNYDYNASIEFDYPDLELCSKIEKSFPGNIGYTSHRFTDDMSAIIHSGVKAGFSYCVPCRGNMHGFGCWTEMSKIVPYYNGLLNLLTKIDFTSYDSEGSVFHSPLNAEIVQSKLQ